MAKDRERSINPAQQQRKLEKAKALKKGKAEVQARRNEKLAYRNPERLQRQVDDLKALEASGEIKLREKQILADLERDIKAIRKAREALGDKAPQFGNRPQGKRDHGQDGGTNILGKRRHDGERKHEHQSRQQDDLSSGSETDDSVRNIPMPRDTPPPIPHSHRRNQRNANLEPLAERRDFGNASDQAAGAPHPLPARPAFVPAAPKTIYESAPQIRDLRKEAVSRFVPSVVRRKQDAVRGAGSTLVEPEEMDRLEAAGYVAKPTATVSAVVNRRVRDDREGHGGAAEGGSEATAKALAEEEQRFRREIEIQMHEDRGEQPPRHDEQPHHRHVEIEEVEDEDM